MRRGESTAQVRFPPGILPRGRVRLCLQSLDFCTVAEHDHFGEAPRGLYPVDEERPYPRTLTVEVDAPRPLSYQRRRSHFAPKLPRLGPGPPLPPALQALLPPLVGFGAGPLAAAAEEEEEEEVFADAQGEPLGEEGGGEPPRHRRAAPEDEGGPAEWVQFSAQFLRPPFFEAGEGSEPLEVTEATTVEQLARDLDQRLTSAHEDLGRLHETGSCRVTLEPLSGDELEQWGGHLANLDEWRVVVVRLPYGVGVHLDYVAQWKMLGFHGGGRQIVAGPSKKKGLVNVGLGETANRIRAPSPVRPRQGALDTYRQIQRLSNARATLSDAEKSVRVYVQLAKASLSFKLDLSSWQHPPPFQQSIRYTTGLLSRGLELTAGSFQFRQDRFLVADTGGGDGGIFLTGFSEAVSDVLPLEFVWTVTFSHLDVARRWGFEDRVTFAYRGVPREEFRIPGPRFKPGDPGLQALTEPERREALLQLQRDLGAVFAVRDWGRAEGGWEDGWPGYLRSARRVHDAERGIGRAEEVPAGPGGEVPPQPAPPQPSPPPSPPPPEVVRIEVPNPEPRPPTAFTPWSSAVRGRCSEPAGFPQRAYILLAEAVASDYIEGLGETCIWGVKKTDNGSTSVASKGAVLFNNDWERVLNVSFLSTDLGSYVHREAEGAAQPVVDGHLRLVLSAKVLAQPAR